MGPAGPRIARRFVETPRGRIHIAAAGEGRPVLLLHQTPRSWDEYREVLPLLGRHYRAIAMDTVGFGDSDALPFSENSIEAWAISAFALLDALELKDVALVGHHTGACIAVDMAVTRPERIAAMVLSSPPYVDADRRAQAETKVVVDDVEVRADGSHLPALWRMRQPFYPEGDTTLLDRFMIDALKAGPLAAEGHRVVGRYRMDERLRQVSCPVRILAASADPHAFPNTAKVATAIPGAEVLEVPGAMVPFPDQMPEVFAEATLSFLARVFSKA
jgi:pimeloyl-ACP methyl ester carboxylesterase